MGTTLGRWIWIVTAALVGLWFVGLAFNVGGDGVHLLLVLAMALLAYELLVGETPA